MSAPAAIGQSAVAARRSGAADTEEASFALGNLRCGGCVASVERILVRAPGIVHARANLTSRRVRVRWRAGEQTREAIAALLTEAGFPAHVFAGAAREGERAYERGLLLALGVAGFAASNIMMLSLAVWWGEASDMDQATRTLFHWMSALIALPVVAFAGRVFFASALTGLRSGRLNMDAPISLAIVLATGMSLYQTVRGSTQVYFDAATSLLFFLLVGRYLATVARRGAQDAAQNLLALAADTAELVTPEGGRVTVAAEDLRPGDRVAVAPGGRIPVDGIVRAGTSDLDVSLLTGEARPAPAAPGADVFAGVLNLTGALEIEATKTGAATLLAEIARLMEAAGQGRARFVRLADRVARLYAPAVHVLGAIAFAATLLAGLGWEEALTRAVAVLIVTCPCALALAVPAAQVAATGRLLRLGMFVKSADALERLAEADCVVMDKTGTLTLGKPELIDAAPAPTLRAAAALATQSRHPLSRALARAAAERGPVVAAPDARETPGMGLSAPAAGGEARLGSAEFVGAPSADTEPWMELWFRAPGAEPLRLRFADALRPDAAEAIARLRAMGLPVELLSGDRPAAVAEAARAVGLTEFAGGVGPREKIARLEALRAAGRRPLMVGDGLNDAPALAAAFASLSPSGAADVAHAAADVVFQGAELGAVAVAVRVARRTRRVVFENFGLALGYNVVFVPLAMTGHVTPLIAAIAMSLSSVSVTLNALRLRRA